jgi:hypothetical protein
LLTLEAGFAPAGVPADDAWSSVWNDAPSQQVPLSAQNIVIPFGGGTVGAVTVKALFDDERLYVNLEWSDSQADAAVNGAELFSDAAALQFPTSGGSATPYTMGSADRPVNIWQWKAVWEKDIEEGFAVSSTRYPDTYTDYYPGGDDRLYRAAEEVGNPVAQRSHTSPIENLIAGGFGTLTTSGVQDVAGSGEWRDGSWRVVFARAMDTEGDDSAASFAVGETTSVALAVWDGASGDRNGQKSIAQFIDLTLGTSEAGVAGDALPSESGAGARVPWVAVVVILAGLVAVPTIVIANRRADRARMP